MEIRISEEKLSKMIENTVTVYVGSWIRTHENEILRTIERKTYQMLDSKVEKVVNDLGIEQMAKEKCKEEKIEKLVAKGLQEHILKILRFEDYEDEEEDE